MCILKILVIADTREHNECIISAEAKFQVLHQTTCTAPPLLDDVVAPLSLPHLDKRKRVKKKPQKQMSAVKMQPNFSLI